MSSLPTWAVWSIVVPLVLLSPVIAFLPEPENLLMLGRKDPTHPQSAKSPTFAPLISPVQAGPPG
jgi:hypothetical protein